MSDPDTSDKVSKDGESNVRADDEISQDDGIDLDAIYVEHLQIKLGFHMGIWTQLKSFPRPGSYRVVPSPRVLRRAQSISLSFQLRAREEPIKAAIYLPFGKFSCPAVSSSTARVKLIYLDAYDVIKGDLALNRADLCNYAHFGAELIVADLTDNKYFRFLPVGQHPGFDIIPANFSISTNPSTLRIHNRLNPFRPIELEVSGLARHDADILPTGHNTWRITLDSAHSRNKIELYALDHEAGYCQRLPIDRQETS